MTARKVPPAKSAAGQPPDVARAVHRAIAVAEILQAMAARLQDPSLDDIARAQMKRAIFRTTRSLLGVKDEVQGRRRVLLEALEAGAERAQGIVQRPDGERVQEESEAVRRMATAGLVRSRIVVWCPEYESFLADDHLLWRAAVEWGNEGGRPGKGETRQGKWVLANRVALFLQCGSKKDDVEDPDTFRKACVALLAGAPREAKRLKAAAFRRVKKRGA
jgi:hypothetical protein